MSENDPVDLTRPRAGCWFFVLPILVAAGVVLGYGTLFFNGARGRPASGPVVEMTFTGCPAALPHIRKRVDEMGLGSPTVTESGDAFTVVAQLPEDPAVAEAIPTTLARPGHLRITDGDWLLEDHVAYAVMRLDLTADPSTAINLDPEAAKLLEDHMVANPTGTLSFHIDTEDAGTRPNDPPETQGKIDLKVLPGERAWRVRTAAERGVILNNGPLPCAPTVTVTPR